ncbi:MAG TPA: head GIN domain-containing protein [Gillisia sp.]|nr:head GIN domain-containing protein [Gillisia sp.]
MKKSILLFAILIISVTSAQAQWWNSSKKVTGNKEVVNQSRTVDNYDRITVTGMMDVQLVSGKEGKIDLEGESNLLEHIETEVSGGTLKISVEKGINLQPTRNYPIKIVVPFEDLDAVSLTGSGHIRGNDVIRAREFKVSVTGSGNMNLNLEVEELKGSVTGSGDVKLRGKARHLDCTVTGSGDFMAYDLRTQTTNASVTGSGDIEISVEDELEAKVSGSGDIRYKGDPKKQNFKTSGSGSVSKN